MSAESRDIFSRLFSPVVLWCVRSGVGYSYVMELLREMFMCIAYNEMVSKNYSVTDEGLSLASGVHKSAVRDFKKRRKEAPENFPDDVFVLPPEASKVNFSDRIIARWVALGWPNTLPLKKGKNSFKCLYEEGASLGDKTYAFVPSMALILSDLQRRGLVKLVDRQVTRIRNVPRGSIHDTEISSYIAGSVADHLLACLENVNNNDPKYLEQSVVIDKLSSVSTAALDACVRKHWHKFAQAVISEATTLCDTPTTGETDFVRVRVGVYCMMHSIKDGIEAPKIEAEKID